MNDERNRIKALGGRGIWSSAFFFPCPGFLGPAPSRVDGKSDGEGPALPMEEKSSVYVPGVTKGAKAICCC